MSRPGQTPSTTTGEITFFNGSKIILLELKYIPSDPLYTRLGGQLLSFGIIDEAGEVPEQGKQILQSRLGRWKNDEYNIKPILYMTCNPSKNFLYRDFYLLSEENKLPKYRKFIQALISDNPHTSKDYEQNLIRSLSLSDRERLIGGNWRYSDDPTNLLDYNDILNTFIKIPAQTFKQRYISADIAFTSDKCVIMLWEDLTLVKIIVNPDKPEDEINRLSKEYNVKSHNVTFDSDGVGKYLSNYLNNATPIVNNARALYDENYDNLKTQLYFKLVEKIKDNTLKIVDNPYNEAIQEELSLIRHKPTDTVGKIQMVSKGDIKRILGHSPDFTDAMAYRMYFELKQNDFDQYQIISFQF